MKEKQQCSFKSVGIYPGLTLFNNSLAETNSRNGAGLGKQRRNTRNAQIPEEFRVLDGILAPLGVAGAKYKFPELLQLSASPPSILTPNISGGFFRTGVNSKQKEMMIPQEL